MKKTGIFRCSYKVSTFNNDKTVPFTLRNDSAICEHWVCTMAVGRTQVLCPLGQPCRFMGCRRGALSREGEFCLWLTASRAFGCSSVSRVGRCRAPGVCARGAVPDGRSGSAGREWVRRGFMVGTEFWVSSKPVWPCFNRILAGSMYCSYANSPGSSTLRRQGGWLMMYWSVFLGHRKGDGGLLHTLPIKHKLPCAVFWFVRKSEPSGHWSS